MNYFTPWNRKREWWADGSEPRHGESVWFHGMRLSLENSLLTGFPSHMDSVDQAMHHYFLFFHSYGWCTFWKFCAHPRSKPRWSAVAFSLYLRLEDLLSFDLQKGSFMCSLSRPMPLPLTRLLILSFLGLCSQGIVPFWPMPRECVPSMSNSRPLLIIDGRFS